MPLKMKKIYLNHTIGAPPLSRFCERVGETILSSQVHAN
jgi:hypothetical protein